MLQYCATRLKVCGKWVSFIQLSAFCENKVSRWDFCLSVRMSAGLSEIKLQNAVFALKNFKSSGDYCPVTPIVLLDLFFKWVVDERERGMLLSQNMFAFCVSAVNRFQLWPVTTFSIDSFYLGIFINNFM